MRKRGANREQLKGHLDLLLLTIVGEGPAHGYDIITALRERSGATFDLPEGTVYPALHRLEASGELASTWTVAAGRRRRTYQLTAAGKAALRAERESWFSFSHAVNTVLAVGT